MSAQTKITQKFSPIFQLILSAVLLTACMPGRPDLQKEPEQAAAAAEETLVEITPKAEPTASPTPSPAFTLPDNLAPISPDNVQNILELASVYPYFPPYYHFSNDGGRFAVGNLQKVEIREAASGKVLSTIPTSLPDCDFGFDRYFRLNADGTFIALVNGQSIQVWQVGGGLIYESPLFSGFTSNAPACGADLPELALSPDGSILAVSGIEYSRTSVKRYFRVIDVLANEVLYKWDGKKETLHGNLYTFYGLGFSDDGRLLQTFDPARFILSEGEIHQAFRFWSAEDWQEVERTASTVEDSFQPGQMLYTWSDSNQIEVQSRLTGEVSSRIPMDGCLWDAPCETRFSPDGSKAVALNRTDEQFLFKNDVLHASFTVWDLVENKETRRETGVLRDLESVLVENDGSLVRADQADSGETGIPGWWTFRDHFAGLQAGSDGKVSFTPLAAISESGQDCQFCTACSIDPKMGAIACSKGMTDLEGGWITLKAEGEKFIAARQDDAEETVLGELALPEIADLSNARVRLLGYSLPQQTLFYCADVDLRQAGCFIYDPYLKEVIAEPKDISFLRFSTDGMTAAFYNRTVNALFLYDLSSKTLTRKYPYQARGYPVNAVFSSDGKTFQYIIQNLNNASDLSVETLDAKTWKSYGRTSLRKAGVTSPTVFTESSDRQVWAFAGKSGEVRLLSPEKGALLYRFQAHLDEIIGMTISPDSTWLLTMGENGILKFWGVSQ